MDSPRRKIRNIVTYGLIGILAVVATLFGVTNGHILGVTPVGVPTATPSVTPANPVDAQPAPVLFKSTDLLPTRLLLTPEFQRATIGIKAFYAGQPSGGAIDDAAFIRWASRRVTAGPSTFARTAERNQQFRILKVSAKKDLSARWLGLHGCGDVWTSYALEQQRFRAPDAPAAKKSELTAVLNLAASVTAATQKRFTANHQAPTAAPCVTRTASEQADCACSYPSPAAAMSAAARMYLSALGPMASRQYGWMEQQVDTAVLYQGTAVPSDVKAGAYLGYLTGRYFVSSRGYGDLAPRPTPTPVALVKPRPRPAAAPLR